MKLSWISCHKIYIDDKFVIWAFYQAIACLIRRSIGKVTACGATLSIPSGLFEFKKGQPRHAPSIAMIVTMCRLA